MVRDDPRRGRRRVARGRQGGPGRASACAGSTRRAAGRATSHSVNEVIDDLTGHANEIARVVTAVARGDLEQTMELEDGDHGPRRGEFLRHARIVNGMVARLVAVRLRGDARRAGGRRRRQARRAGARAGRLGRVEGPDRLREPDGVEPDVAGARDRARDDGGRAGRPDQDDHDRRQGRDPRAQEHDQHDGRAAARVRQRGDARRARGRHRGPARRSGDGARRVRRVARADRARQLDGEQPDVPGPQHRRGDDARSPPAISARRSPSRRRARSSSLKNTINTMVDQLSRVRRRGDARRARGRHRGRARRSGARSPTCRACGAS